MIRNYLLVALRNIIRHKLYSFINICGLAVGLACVIFIILFIRDELSYDKWIPGTQNLYRIEKTSYLQGRDPFAMAFVPFRLPAAMHDAIPEVAAMTRLHYFNETLSTGDRQFREKIAFVEPNFFNIIKLPLMKGDPSSVFRDAESAVLSQSVARKYFGIDDAIGKIIRTMPNCEAAADIMACRRRLVPLRITGILRDIPHNSHFDGDVFVPNTSITDQMVLSDKQTWFGGDGYGYVVLAPGAKPQTVISKMTPLLDRAIPPEPNDSRKGSQRWGFHLTPFADVHLTSGHWRFNEKPPGSLATLYGAGIVGLLILLLACFNFMNLATARALMRAREIGIRKTHGAARLQLIAQFLGEAVLMAMLSLVLALALVEILQPAFGRLLQHSVGLHYARDWQFLLVIVGIAIAAGLISGGYPALVLSSFKPVAVLRTNSVGQAGSGRLRTALVVLQFAVSIGLGIVVMVVFGQISFARSIDLGFRKDNLLVVPTEGLITLGGGENFLQRLRYDPGILDVAVSNAVPFGTYGLGMLSVRVPGRSELVALNMLTIGTDTVHLLGARLVAGRLLSRERALDEFDANGDTGKGANDGRNILVDDTAAASMGFTPQQAIGKTIILDKSHVRIVGVLANVKFGGVRERARATMYIYDPHVLASVLVRLRPGTEQQTLTFIKHAWHQFAPTKAMDPWLMDDAYGKQYGADERQGEMFAVFVGIAIFIACLGLFGLAAFSTERRTREIGLRKTFGARTRDLVFLLLWQFSIPVLIANAIAWPVAWYYLHGWLLGFAYRIPLSPVYFLAAGAGALAIAWATVIVHAWRVANANPVHALRYE